MVAPDAASQSIRANEAVSGLPKAYLMVMTLGYPICPLPRIALVGS